MPRRKLVLDAADFAKAVIAAYKANLNEVPSDSINPHVMNRDVRRVANGLALLQQLAARQIADMKEQKDLGLDETGIVEALEMIEALTTGRDHPLWRHVKGLRSKTRVPTALERFRRCIILGVLEALRRKGVKNDTEAINNIVANYHFPGDRFKLSPHQIKGWRRKLGPEADAQQVLVDAAASTFIQKADSLTSPPDVRARILGIGLNYFRRTWGVARPPDR